MLLFPPPKYILAYNFCLEKLGKTIITLCRKMSFPPSLFVLSMNLSLTDERYINYTSLPCFVRIVREMV